jgi:hypothetical protein
LSLYARVAGIAPETIRNLSRTSEVGTAKVDDTRIAIMMEKAAAPPPPEKPKEERP